MPSITRRQTKRGASSSQQSLIPQEHPPGGQSEQTAPMGLSSGTSVPVPQGSRDLIPRRRSPRTKSSGLSQPSPLPTTGSTEALQTTSAANQSQSPAARTTPATPQIDLSHDDLMEDERDRLLSEDHQDSLSEEGELEEEGKPLYVAEEEEEEEELEYSPLTVPRIQTFEEARAELLEAPPKAPTPENIFLGLGLHEIEMTESERLTSKIQEEILQSLEALPVLFKEQLPTVLTVRRFFLGTSPKEHEYIHSCMDEAYPLRSVEKRMIFSLRPMEHNMFHGASATQKAQVIKAFGNQQALFHEWDCCKFDDLKATAERTLEQVIDWVVQSTPDDFERQEIAGMVTLFSRFTMAQKIKLLPRAQVDRPGARSHSPSREALSLMVKEVQQLRNDLSLLRQERAQMDRLPRSSIEVVHPVVSRVQNPPQDYSDFLNESQHQVLGAQGSNLLVQAEPIPKWTTFVPGKENHRKLLNYLRGCKNTGQNICVPQWPTRLKQQIALQYRFFREVFLQSSERDNYPVSWESMTVPALISWLETMLTTNIQELQEQPVERFIAKLMIEPPVIDWSQWSEPHTHPFIQQSADLIYEWVEIKSKTAPGDNLYRREAALVKQWNKSLVHSKVSTAAKARLSAELKLIINDLTDFQEAVSKTQDFMVSKMASLRTAAEIINPEGLGDSSLHKRKRSQEDSPKESSSKGPKGKKPAQTSAKPSADSSAATAKPLNRKQKSRHPCRRCGWNQTLQGDKMVCMRGDCTDDPRRNTSNKDWYDSVIGQAWVKAGFHRGIPRDKTITLANAVERRLAMGKSNWLTLLNKDNSLINNLLPFSVVFKQRQRRKSKRRLDSAPTITGTLLLDSGAIGSCVVSSKFASKLNNVADRVEFNSVHHELFTALNNCHDINKTVKFSIALVSEDKKHKLEVDIDALVADTSIDLIIDKQTIIKYNLLFYFPSDFAHGQLLKAVQSLSKPPVASITSKAKRTKSSLHPSLDKLVDRQDVNAYWVNTFIQHASLRRRKFLKRHKATVSKLRRRRRQLLSQSFLNVLSLDCNADNDSDRGAESQTEEVSSEIASHASYINHLTSNISTKPAFEREGNLTEIPDNKLESIPAELISSIDGEADYTKVHIFGPPLLRQQLKQIIQEFKDIFRSTVQGEPAQLTPFQLSVDPAKWFIPANRINVRPMDRERAQALDELVAILLEHNIIEECDESYCSRAFLVPKSNRKWRLVLDFKNLNKATTNYYSWPLPNIQVMLVRVGDSRPKFFAVFDLTSGYYQAPISIESRKFTAFKTPHGVYRWKRLPMGLTGACSYFQHSLATQVLQGLLHNGVELYLDDCMVHADSIDTFIDRLRKVFLRFRQSGITLNPAKCNFGLPKIEFVGHTIDSDGLHFTRDKLDSVLNFPRPLTKRQLKSFLGLANYFRNHIRNHSMRVEALQGLVAAYDKRQANHKIKWTDEAIASFEDIRKAIDECPKLWFLDDYSPIFLQTDASDYGIGAYLYQKVEQDDGSLVEHPVGFISKAISAAHTSWDTPMKEGFAIFYALQKWEYLLRDRQFTVLTDHKNLTALRADHFETNKMVKRWFLAYQEYDILNWEYRKGADNAVPDAFSRLCPKDITEHPAVHLFQLTGTEIPPKEWDLIKRFHNSLERGHGGIERTRASMERAGLSWPNMHKHITQFIRLCPCCQKMDQMKKVIHSYPFTTSSYGLWHTVSVDFIERLPPDDYGYMGIIVIVDNFSRFTDLYPVTALNSEQAADALLSFTGRYATPTAFCTDSGATFKNLIVSGLLERLGADHVLTTAYSKEQNAIVERQNKEVLRHLRNIIMDRRVARKWSKYLPIVQRVINSSVNSSTGLAPAQIVFPNGITMDRGLLTEANPIFLSSYIRDMQDAQGHIIALCEATLRSKDAKHMEEYPEERTSFEEGSYVLAEHRHNSLRRGPKSKLLPFLRGPLLVKSRKDKGIYVLQDIVSQRLCDYHVSKLRPFQYDPNSLNPLDIAVTDLPDEFVVEACLGIRGNLRGPKSQLEFQVRWLGYGPEDDTWEPWKCVKDNEIVLSWLYTHEHPRIRRLVPNGYVPPQDREVSEDESMSDSD